VRAGFGDLRGINPEGVERRPRSLRYQTRRVFGGEQVLARLSVPDKKRGYRKLAAHALTLELVAIPGLLPINALASAQPPSRIVGGAPSLAS
jgi:hypothetical protein